MFDGLKYLVVGSGFCGAVLAERIASVLKEKVLVIERRNHIGGNSWSEIDPETGIEYHKYGSHIFHTSDDEVWNYVNRFATFTNYQHKVWALHNGKTYAMPINLKTINDFYGLNLSPSEAEEFIHSEARKSGIAAPANLAEKAISQIGEKLYHAFIHGYTWKQWEHDPRELSPSIITRLPVRHNYNMNYFNDPHQGIPLAGYGNLFRKILDHPNITVLLNTDYRTVADQVPRECKVIYTGMTDQLFDERYGALEWRSLRFEWERPEVSDFQGTTVMNYTDREVPFTRIHEFKHYHPERREVFLSNRTLICREYSQHYRSGEEAYYPVNNAENNARFERYRQEAEHRGILLAGRLATYSYLDMDKTIKNALDIFSELKEG